MFRRALVAIILTASLTTNSYADKGLVNLETLEWQNRIIMVRVAQNFDQKCEQTIQTFKQFNISIEDRNIVWFVLCQPQSEQTSDLLISNYAGEFSPTLSKHIEQRYFKSINDTVVLIGKDGGVKYRANELDLESINRLIDSMPMRQFEMSEKNNR